MEKGQVVKRPVIRQTATTQTPTTPTIPPIRVPIISPIPGMSGLGFSPGELSPDDIEISKTPLGSITANRNHIINMALGFGGAILLILGIIGLMMPSRKQIESGVRTAIKASEAAA